MYEACSVHSGQEGACMIWCEKLKKGCLLGDVDVDGRIILRWIFRKWDGGHGLDFSSAGQGQVAGYCECGIEAWGSVKCGEFLD